MKAQLNFDLEDRDDRLAHMRCVYALDLALTIYEIEKTLIDDQLKDKEKLKGIMEIIRCINLSELIE